jgi:hypothetical protein
MQQEIYILKWTLVERCGSQLYIAVTDICNNQLIKLKGLFWLTVLVVSVHSPFTLLFLGVVRQHIMAG